MLYLLHYFIWLRIMVMFELWKYGYLYMSVIKTLLGVRKTTCCDICLIESGFMSLSDAVSLRRTKYFQGECINLPNTSILSFALQLVESIDIASNILIRDILLLRFRKRDCLENTAKKGRQSDSSKRLTYISLNPTLNAPFLHLSRTVPEYKRIRYSQFRLHPITSKLRKAGGEGPLKSNVYANINQVYRPRDNSFVSKQGRSGLNSTLTRRIIVICFRLRTKRL